MIHPVKFVRFAISFALDAAGERVLEAELALARSTAISDEVARVVGPPLNHLREVLERLAAKIDPGGGYIPFVKPSTDTPLHYWMDEPYSTAFAMIEQSRAIAQDGPR